MRVAIPAFASVSLSILGIWFLVTHLCGDLWRWYQFKDATETDILAVLTANKGVKTTRPGSATVLEVLWSYEVDGRPFQSDSISVHKLRDDFDRFRDHLYNRLKSEKPGTCFYLKERPRAAVIDRSLRVPTLLLGSLFSFGPLVLGTFFGRAAVHELRN